MIALAILFHIIPIKLVAANLLTQCNGFDHRAIAIAAASHVVNRAGFRVLEKFVESPDKIIAMNVVSNLFALVTENCVWHTRNRTFHQIGKKAMKLGAGMIGSCETPATKATGTHSEVATILLYQHVSSHFRSPEQAMHSVIDRH